jgi:hypothetical protein
MAAFLKKIANAISRRNRSGDARVPEDTTTGWLAVFNKMPRELRIEILLEFTADEIDDVFCNLNRTYRRIYCGDMTLAAEIPESEVVYEHWLRRLRRDYGISHNPEECRGHTPAERIMVATAFNRVVPTQNRLNSYFAQAYGSIYQAMRKLGQRPIVGAQKVCVRDHIVFLSVISPKYGKSIVMTTSVDLVYAQIKGVEPFGTVLYTPPEGSFVPNYELPTTNAQGGTYFIMDRVNEVAKLVHFHEDGVNVSKPIRFSRDYFYNNVYADPFAPNRAYAVVFDKQAEQTLTSYRMTCSDRSATDPFIRFDQPVEKISQQRAAKKPAGSYDYVNQKELTLSFTGFSLLLLPSELRVKLPEKTVGVALESKRADVKRTTIKVVPLSRLDSGSAPNVRIVVVQKIADADAIEVTAVECKNGTAEPIKATRYMVTKNFALDGNISYQIENGKILRLQNVNYYGGLRGATVTQIYFVTLDLDSGRIECGDSTTDYSFTNNETIDSTLSLWKKVTVLSAQEKLESKPHLRDRDNDLFEIPKCEVTALEIPLKNY